MAKTTTEKHTHRLGSIRVEPGMAAKLDRLSAREGRSINELVREALDRYLRSVERRNKA